MGLFWQGFLKKFLLSVLLLGLVGVLGQTAYACSGIGYTLVQDPDPPSVSGCPGSAPQQTAIDKYCPPNATNKSECNSNDEGGTDGRICCYVAPAATAAWAENILVNFLDPFYEIILVTARLIGILLVFWGLMRLRRGAQQNMMQRTSPIATTFFFIVGAIFTSFMPEVFEFSNGIFGNITYTDSYTNQTYTGANHDLFTTDCSDQSIQTGNGIPLTSRVNCPVLGYVNEVEQISNNSTQDNSVAYMIQVIYAILLVVGLISFLRGCLFLLKLGEGGGQDNPVQKAVVHIIAGVIGMNAEVFQHLMQGILPSGLG